MNFFKVFGALLIVEIVYYGFVCFGKNNKNLRLVSNGLVESK